MRKVLSILVLITVALILIGCPEYQLRDDTQVENLQTLKDNYTQQQDYFADGEVPPDYLVDSFSILLDSAYDLENSKGESWQEHAEDQGWEEPAEEEDEGGDN